MEETVIITKEVYDKIVNFFIKNLQHYEYLALEDGDHETALGISLVEGEFEIPDKGGIPAETWEEAIDIISVA